MNHQALVSMTGLLNPAEAGVTDAHNHVWIAPTPGAREGAPVLDDKEAIREELAVYYQAGGRTILDCQPGGCGRDGKVLRELAEDSRVNLVACTGFHLEKYYPKDCWLFRASQEAAGQYFIDELATGMEETLNSTGTALAGFIKIACLDSLEKTPAHLLEAAVSASRETGAAIMAHTERGAGVERIVEALQGFGLPLNKLVLCHMDKRADFTLHRDLAQEGILLEYDTFYRPRYQPEHNVWPLLERMVSAGLAGQVAIATDMAEASLWARIGNGPGLTGLLTQIIPRLGSSGYDPETIGQLVGSNIASRLARPMPNL